MKRAIVVALVALTILVPLADAKVLVIASNGTNSTSDTNYRVPVRDRWQSVVGVLSEMGVDFDVISTSNDACKTEYCRTGTFVYGAGTSAARAVSYSAVIHVGEVAGLNNLTRLGYRADSLTLIGPSQPRTIKYVQVPQIFLSYNGLGYSEGASDSTLLSHADNTNTSSIGQTMWVPGSTNTYRAGIAKVFSTTSLGSAQAWPGGSRMLLRAGTGDGVFTVYQDGNAPRPKGDSLLTGFISQSQTARGSDDTCVVFAKKFDNIPACNGSALVFVQDSDNNESMRDCVPFMLALAYVDSLTSGSLFSTSNKLPIKFGLQVRGAFSRGSQLGFPLSTGGMTTTDSTNYIASIDSIAALGIPFVVGVNVDSIAAYSNYDKRWWARAPMAKYGVYQSSGLVSDSVWIASRQRPLDIFGVKRKRYAFGDSAVHTIQTSDTSIAQLARSAMAKLDSTWGAGKVDRVLMAPYDDWMPLSSGHVGRDSVLYALDAAGAKGLVINTWRTPIRDIGYSFKAESVPLRYNPGRSFKLLATPGYLDSGSVTYDFVEGTPAYRRNFGFIERQWRSRLEPGNTWSFWANDGLSSSSAPLDSTHKAAETSIVTVFCSDLQSGTRGDASTLPTRPAWHNIKNLTRGMQVVNAYAYQRRTIVTWAYPEDIEP